MAGSPVDRVVRCLVIGIVAIAAGCGGGSSPSSPSPTPTATTSPAPTPTPTPTPTTPQVLTDTRLTAIISRSSELGFSAINDAMEKAGISITLGGSSPLAFSDVRMVNTIQRIMFACPNGGTATIDVTISGVLGTKADNLQISERQTYLNCAVTFDDGQTVTVAGTLTGIGAYGKTPSGQQSFRRTGGFTYLLEPSLTTARCEEDLSINYLNLKDPRATAVGTACARAINILLPPVGPTFGKGTQQTPPSPAPGAAPESGLYKGSYSYNPSRCGNYASAGWVAIFRVDGAFVDITYTSFFLEGEVLTMRIPINNRAIHFVIQSILTITFDGTFSSDYQTIEGAWSSSPCISGGDILTGKWSGSRQ